EGLVARREVRGGRTEPAAEVLRGAAGGRRVEELVEVGVGEPALALLGQREAVREVGALGLLAAVQRVARAGARGRRLRVGVARAWIVRLAAGVGEFVVGGRGR